MGEEGWRRRVMEKEGDGGREGGRKREETYSIQEGSWS